MPGAVIVLLPADPEALAHPDGDPADKLHVTMLYLSDEPLPPDQYEQVTHAIASCAGMPPIDANVSGAGMLGKDAAIVLILESQNIVDLRDSLGAACQGLMEAEQFPSFIPHLTIGYAESVEQGQSLLDHVLPMVGDVITLDRLACLNGDERHEVPLGTKADGTEIEGDGYAAPIYTFAAPAAAPPAAPGAAAPAPGPAPVAGAQPPRDGRHVILVGMPMTDPSKVPYKNTGLPYQSPEPYVALCEVKIRKNEVPEQLAQVLRDVHPEPTTSTATKSLTASDTKPARRAVLMEPGPLAAASELIKASLEPYGTNVDDYPFVVQLGNEGLTKNDVTALKGQALDFAGLIAVLQDGTVIHEDKGGAPAAGEGSSPEPTTPDTVAAT